MVRGLVILGGAVGEGDRFRRPGSFEKCTCG